MIHSSRNRRTSLIFLAIFIIGPTLFHLGLNQNSKRAPQSENDEQAFVIQREAMVRNQLEARGIRDPNVLQAMRKVKRHALVPFALMPSAYQDSPLPIGHGQTISQPYIVAYMSEALALGPEDRVLEIGTGSGYQAAVLAEIVKEVYSIEIIPELAQEAREKLQKLGYSNITIKQGDGYEGWPDHQPFDAIIVTAAPDTIPPKLLEQLKNPGGRMILPVGSYYQELILVVKTDRGIVQKQLLPVRFVPMVSEQSAKH